MQDERVTGHQAANLFEAFEVELGFTLEFVRAVAGADGDGERVAAGTLHELHGLIGIGIDAVLGRDVFLNPGKAAQLGFHPDAVGVGVFHDPFGHGDVLFEGVVRTVDHHGGEAAVHAGLADVEIRAVVQMEHNRKIRFQQTGLNKLHNIILSRIFAGSGGNLKDERGLFLGSCLHDPLNDFHVVDVEGADGITFFVGPFKHGSGRGKRHSCSSPQPCGCDWDGEIRRSGDSATHIDGPIVAYFPKDWN